MTLFQASFAVVDRPALRLSLLVADVADSWLAISQLIDVKRAFQSS